MAVFGRCDHTTGPLGLRGCVEPGVCPSVWSMTDGYAESGLLKWSQELAGVLGSP